ncbi:MULTISPECIES: MFS transporter [unclassified Streptomyces]|uniref:MFS transporter n=1 Tax=unclassified Streptomyces TaxID=2593676 RepID=UPI002DDA631A|nr:MULTISPECIES: MFS transporter [unclassified Streptomyces]WSC42214.1 MFS transporter [Streptomyces sp. NBC_01763]WSC58933.1 MFS transporter [Streptomyces sp. NBC_01761]WSF90055.1 MFS transporter [Streptomyces sp. NBC_01744]WSJ56266.1 MFS transporter [Streptomyces sp. NBC_01318]
MFLAAMDSAVTATAAPQIVADLGDGTAFSWLLTAYVLAATVSGPLYGRLADTHGRRPVLVGGTLLFLSGSALCAAGWNMPSLVAFRSVQGLGAGAIQVTVQTVAGDLYQPHERGRIQAALASVWSVAALAGPAVGGALAQYGHWRGIFLLNLPLGLAAVWLLVRRFPVEDVRSGTSGPVDWRGALGLLLTCATLMTLLVQGGTAWPWVSVQSGALLTVLLALILTTARIERRAVQPFMPGWVWQRRELAVPSLVLGLLGVIMTAPLLLLPVYAQAVLGLGPAAGAAVLAGMTFGWPTAAVFSSGLYLRVGFRDAALTGAATVTVALVATVSLTVAGAHALLFVAASTLLGIGLGLLQPALLVGVQAAVTWDGRGAATANLMFCRETGQSLGAALFGALFNAAGNPGIAVATDCAAVCEERVAAGLRYTYFAGAGFAAAMVLLLLMTPRTSVRSGGCTSSPRRPTPRPRRPAPGVRADSTGRPQAEPGSSR